MDIKDVAGYIVSAVVGFLASFFALKGKRHEGDSSLAAAQAAQTAELVREIRENSKEWQLRHDRLEEKHDLLAKQFNEIVEGEKKCQKRNRQLMDEVDLLKEYIRSDAKK